MKINRDEVLKNLKAFSISDNGVIIGKPGIGKSFLIKELRKTLLEDDILSFVIKIDRTFDSSDDAITEELEFENNWIDTLKSIYLKNGQKAILIFDAFDAARDEAVRKGFLRQIKKAINQLSEKCIVIVSARTYDALKSPDLINLFPLDKNRLSSINCRRFEINELKDQEINESIKDNPQLLKFYNESNHELRQILKIPFFLILLADIINRSTSTELETVKKYKSEIQLLNFYWEKTVVNTTNHIVKEHFISKYANALTRKRSLNISKSELFDLFPVFPQEVFNYLRSENIIDEVSSDTRLIFSHNIFFDYAVNLYVIPKDYENLLSFIEEDETRPFFLRPSFVYFFTTLWYNEREKFWNFYSQLSAKESKEIQLLVRLILNGVIVSEYSNVEELDFIIKHESEAQKPILIRNVLQSIRFSKAQLNNNDTELLLTLSQKLEGSDFYIFDFAFLLERAINGIILPEYKDKCGIAARSLLNYILHNRNSTNKHFLDRIGAYRGVELVSKTYSTDKNESKKVLSKMFDLLKELDFEIFYFSSLSESIKFIVRDDPEFVADVYKVVFNHTETSDSPTQMGGSVIMSLRSNRRQDFELCYFRLEEFFPEFINASPSIALNTGMQIVNEHIAKEQLAYHEKINVINFQYGDLQCEYMVDLSSIWASDNHSHRSARLVDSIILYINTLIKNGDTTYYTLLSEYIKNAKAAFTWKQLLKLGIEFPSQLISVLYPLIIVPIMIESPDTSFEVRELIEKANEFLNDEQLKIIEETIFQVYDESRDYVLSSILSRIPFERLQLERSKKFMSGKQKVENTPGVVFSSSVTSYTTNEWLEEQGVDLTDSRNNRLSELSNDLEIFNQQNLNSTLEIEESKLILEKAKSIYETLTTDQSETHADLYFTVLKEVTKSLVIISRNLNGIDDDNYNFLRGVIIKSFSFYSKHDLGNDKQSDVRIWSPTPRIDAAEALINLYKRSKNEDDLKLFKEAINDENAVVRLHATKDLIHLADINYTNYWNIISDRLIAENNTFIYASLLNNLKFKVENIKAQAAEVIKIASTKHHFFKGSNEFIQTYPSTLIWLLKRHNIEEAKQELLNAYDNVEVCRNVIFTLFRDLHPSYPQNDFINHPENYEPLFQIIKHYIEECGATLKNGTELDLQSDNKEIKDALNIINEIIVRIFFQLDTAKVGRQNVSLQINNENRRAFYFLIKPIFKQVIELSSTITSNGLILANTAHYFIQSLNKVLEYDPADILSMIWAINKCAASASYTFDSMAIREMVSITEKLFADHRDLLLQDDSFKNLINLLDLYINSGWTEALELLWKLDEVFK